MRHARLPFALLAAATSLAAAGCAPGPSALAQAVSVTSFKAGPMIEGVAYAPRKLVEAALVSDRGAGIVANNTQRWALLASRAEVVLPEAVVYLSDPAENFYRQAGKPITTTTDRRGAYRFEGSFPRGVPTIVSAVLNGNRRVVGFALPDDGSVKVNLSVASTYVTEFLRQAAAGAGKSMASFDVSKLGELVAATDELIDAGELAVPDLEVGRIGELNRAYALAVGRNTRGLGDRWAALLGRRVLALETIAGNGDAGDRGDTGKATLAELYRPRAAIADAFGHIYIADEGNDRVRKIDARTGVISAFAGSGRGGFAGDGGPAAEAALNDPRAVALDAAGNLYVADQLNCRIRRVDGRTGVIETFAGNPVPDGAGGWLGAHAGDGGQAALARFFAPRGLAFDAAGDMYVVDSEKDTRFHVVRKIDMKTGLISTVVGTVDVEGGFDGDGGKPEAARLNYPNQIAFDAQGRLLIADTENHCIRRVDFTGRSIATIAGIGGQKGDDPDGQPAIKTRLDTPYGVAVAPDGRIFFSERGPGRVRMLAADGTCKTLAGGGSDVRDGDARTVRLIQPHDLFVDASGNLLVADTRGSRVRRLILEHGI